MAETKEPTTGSTDGGAEESAIPMAHLFSAPDHDHEALADTVRELERHSSSGGWDGPVRVFALVRTKTALENNPQLAQELPPDVIEAANMDDRHLISIEQENLPKVDGIGELLARIAWPETVDGAAVVIEQIVVPPEIEAEMPDDPAEALKFVQEHPLREDVRMAVGAMRDGTSWCALRTRRMDDDDAVAGAPDLVPALVEAVRGTLAP